MKVSKKMMVLVLCSILGLSACGTSTTAVAEKGSVSKQNGLPYKDCTTC